METLVFALPGNELLANNICRGLGAGKGELETRKFPDGETYVRVMSCVKEKSVILVCTLHEPDDKLLPLYFLSKSMRDAGAKKIILVTPYLAYMRQDKVFNTGEIVTSRYFAGLVSSFADALVTVDPHLHRIHNMNEIYSIPCMVLHASNLISQYIKNEIENPVLIGPDSESRQWVEQVAENAKAPFIILEKQRHGDTDVTVSMPHIDKFKNHTPVLVDDIISTAHTMLETIQHLRMLNMKAPVCIGVHAVFAANSYEELKNAGMQKIVTCNTIAHESNGIDITLVLTEAIKQLLSK